MMSGGGPGQQPGVGGSGAAGHRGGGVAACVAVALVALGVLGHATIVTTDSPILTASGALQRVRWAVVMVLLMIARVTRTPAGAARTGAAPPSGAAEFRGIA